MGKVVFRSDIKEGVKMHRIIFVKGFTTLQSHPRIDTTLYRDFKLSFIPYPGLSVASGKFLAEIGTVVYDMRLDYFLCKVNQMASEVVDKKYLSNVIEDHLEIGWELECKV
jgi:hypothetical protein